MNAEEDKTQSPAPRRLFLQEGTVCTAGFAAASHDSPTAQQKSGDPLPQLAQPLKSYRVVERKSVGEPPRQQHYLESEMIGSNDVKVSSKAYTKRTDMADSYEMVTIVVNEHYEASTDQAPAGNLTVITSITGAKGPVVGDYRLDTVSADGPRQVKVLLNDPTSGMSDQERRSWMLNYLKTRMPAY
jgi:hypothetical protein